ncbi:hypothetical protein CFC21_091592 [Triticum aestivum]|uniref:Uncharacterized protein n=3 Tax=Triticinae TaxID=1648030 RepID=A0A3B6QDC5_WHEAT|nr:putative ripening-related protein 6 [Aegilops tauschii subsp. strangulata]KAF7088491.1 hypothetical protein CFC21_091592 [Triticum aestivum]
MANTKLAFVAMLVILLQASARHHAGGDTPGVMTINDFDRGEGFGPSECDGRYHSNRDMVAALSTRWYEGGRRCERMIRITSTHTGRTVEAKVVDECDSKQGCADDIVDTSLAVWKALGLDANADDAAVITWSDA